MEIKDRLIAIRNKQGLTQEAMARALGLGVASWKRLELENRAPQPDILKKLVGMGFSVDWLLTGVGQMEREQIAPQGSIGVNDAFMGLVFEGMKRIYSEQNARIDDRNAGELAAHLYKEALLKCEDAPDRDDFSAALYLVLSRLKRDLSRSETDDGVLRQA